MTKMTYVAAIEAALTYLPDEIDDEVRERLTALRDQLAKQKQATDAKREEHAERRREYVKPILSLITTVIENEPLTAKEIWARTYGKGNRCITVNQMQYILTHELADEVVRIDNGHSKPYTYQLKTQVEEG